MKRSSNGVFIGVNHAFDNWTFQTNIRRDVLEITNSDANAVVTKINPNSTSGLLGIGYALSPQWKLTSSVSNGFSAPTAFDVSQDAKLTPEKFQAKEFGVSYLGVHQTFRIVYFEIDTTNSIEYSDDSPYEPSNAYITKNRGIESTGQTEWGGIRIRASLVIQNPRNLTYDEALSRRAKRYGSLDLTNALRLTMWALKFLQAVKEKTVTWLSPLRKPLHRPQHVGFRGLVIRVLVVVCEQLFVQPSSPFMLEP
jgi:outer membrane cobalamin receptor